MPSLGSVVRVISKPDTANQQNLFPINRSDRKKADPAKTASLKKPAFSAVPSSAYQDSSGQSIEVYQDQFLSLNELITPKNGFIKKAKQKTLDDIFEMIRGNQWENIIALYHPVDEKVPELVMSEMDLPVREKVAFALGHLNRFDEAINELAICIRREPDNFYTRSSLAYTAYNSLFALKNKEIMLTPQVKARRIAMAHDNFRKAQELRPGTVTCFYRHGMLCSKIEDKPELALSLFRKACDNWERMDERQKAEHHQEKKNYIKSLYRLGSLMLTNGDPKGALHRLTTCLELDKERNHISLTFKYFALGKIHFHLENYKEAMDALGFAIQSSKGRPDDFVVEMLARTFLALKQPSKALEVIKRIPENLRRPYFRWTEADVLCALHRFTDAEQVLKSSCEKDMRSKHKSLIRLAKIYYIQRNFSKAAGSAKDAVDFFHMQWGNPYREGIFWQAIATLRAGRVQKAEDLALELQEQCPNYPRLDMLLESIRNEQKY